MENQRVKRLSRTPEEQQKITAHWWGVPAESLDLLEHLWSMNPQVRAAGVERFTDRPDLLPPWYQWVELVQPPGDALAWLEKKGLKEQGISGAWGFHEPYIESVRVEGSTRRERRFTGWMLRSETRHLREHTMQLAWLRGHMENRAIVLRPGARFLARATFTDVDSDTPGLYYCGAVFDGRHYGCPPPPAWRPLVTGLWRPEGREVQDG